MRRTLTLALALAGAATTTWAQKRLPGHVDRPKVPLAWNRLRNYPEIVAVMQRLAAAHPGLVSLRSLGKSSEGRDLWMARIFNPASGPERMKTAMFIDGNIHGNEVQGTDACLYTIWYLTENYRRIPFITRLVDQRVFYIVPSVNPDGRAWWFDHPNSTHSSRSGKEPHDDDGDGKADEDGPDDLDGDGEITMMRRKVPLGEGTHRVSPDDPRVMVPVKRWEKGDYILLGWEGIDNDGDGRVNEDPPGGYDMNRNWPAGWQPRYVQPGAGWYPFSHPETRAVGEFVLSRPNIAGFQSYHNFGGMILRGPGWRAAGEYPPADRAVYDRLGAIGQKMLPFYRYMVIWKDLYTVHGGEVNWAAEELGIVSFTNEMWTQSRYRARQTSWRQRGGALAQVRWNDRLLMGEAFVPWKPYEHPTYGRIEIGGWKRMHGRVPPAFMIEEMLHRNSAFTLVHADSMPRVVIDRVETTKLGARLWRIDAVAANPQLIPTRTIRARQKRIGRRDLFRIECAGGARAIAGGKLAGRAAYRFVPKKADPARVWFDEGIGSYGRARARWLVAGAGSVTVVYDAEKGGVARRTVTLRG